MIVQGPQYIHEELNLKPGDRFLVNIRYPLTVHDEAYKLNGQWLTIERVHNRKDSLFPMGAEDEMCGYPHLPKRDKAISKECDYATNSNFYWWDMEAIDIANFVPLMVATAEQLPDI